VNRAVEVQAVNRRRFLDWLTRVAGTVLGGMALYPVIRYIIPPRIPEAAIRRVTAAKAGEIAPASFKIFPGFGARPGILIHMANDEYRALSAVCTHLECTVQYRSDQEDIWCACHNGVYDLEGRNVSGPPPRPLERYVAHVVGNEIVVEKSPSN
jgi:Rieske Fe-S protein